MKKLVLGAAAAAALIAPAVAQAETNAYVGIDYSRLHYGGLGDFNSYGMTGAFNHDFSNGWQIQMDGAADRVDFGSCCIAQDYAAVHYGTRTDTYSFAGFVGLQNFVFFSGLDAGVEGQMHFGQASVGGSVSYVDFSDISVNAWNTNVDGAYYFTPNFAVNAGVAYTNVDGVFGSGHTDYWSWNVGGEYRFDNCPFSVTLGYRQSDLSGSNVNAWTIGINLDLGTGDLQARRVHGPSWGGARSMYDDFNAIPPL